MFTILKKIFHYLISLSPRTYALCYLTLIPVFALIYGLLPKHFYHTTVQYERAYYKDSEEILSEMRENVVSFFIKHYGTSTVLDTSYKESISEYKIKHPNLGSKLDITDCDTNLKFHFGTSSQRSQVLILKKLSQNATTD